MGQNIFQLVRSVAILYAMLYLGNGLASLIPVGIPASIWGLLLLFLGLTTQIIKHHWVFLGASLLIRYMALLFIPVSVGIMKYSDLLINQAKVLLIPNVLSTCLTLVSIGFMADYLFSRNSFAHLRKKVMKKREREIR